MKFDISRRDFLAGAVAAGAAASIIVRPGRAAAQDDSTSTAPAVLKGTEMPLKVGVIGAGSRGGGAAIDAVNATAGITITAIGDAFEDKVNKAKKRFQEKIPEACAFTDETCFHGLDNYQKVLETDCDLVILAAPPGFRPQHFEAAIKAGKHVFMEKPVAVDPTGIRKILESAKLAKEKGLGVGAGTQRRHSRAYNEIIKRIHDGAIGDIVAAQCYWMQEGLWVVERKPEFSDAEWMMRNWLYFDWTSGDHIVEQHVHNLDVINWAMGSHPVKATGMGGREVRTDEKYGNIFDHFAVEYEYENGMRLQSMARQTPGAVHRVSERIVGTKGTSDPSKMIKGANPYSFEAGDVEDKPYEQEHANLIRSIREGNPINEGENVAHSTLTAIMGRMSAYTGRTISWDWVMKSSKLDLMPKDLTLGDVKINEVPVPGVTPLV